MREAIGLVVLSAALAGVAMGAEWRIPEVTGRSWDFPADHHALNDYRNEWWYVTGHLAPPGEPDPRWGFQVTFFRVGLSTEEPDSNASWSARDLVMGHAALTDAVTGEHVFSEVLVRAVEPLGGFGAPGDSTLAWCAAPPGTPGRWRIGLVDQGFSLHVRDDRRDLDLTLTLNPTRPMVLHGPGGYSPKSAEGSEASLYYSYPRLEVEGTVDEAVVRGRAWFDREVFTGTLSGDRLGWDWASLQLDDGRDLMLFVLRRGDGGVDFGRGTLVESSGGIRRLTPRDWSWNATGAWTSPRTGATYPSGWVLAVPTAGLSLRWTPRVPGCENVAERSGRTYWEGPIRIEGTSSGWGYVELTGYDAPLGSVERP